MSRSPVFSILVPINAHHEFFQPALRSLERAVDGSSDCEAIIVLDGMERMAPLRQIGRGTKITVSPSRGISAALNWGVHCAAGEYIVRMDGDDLCHPSRFRDLRRLIAAMPDIVAGAIVKFGACRARYEPPPDGAQQAIEDLLHRGYAFAHPATAVRRAAFLAAGGYDSHFDGCEDLDLWLRMLQAGATFTGSRTPHLFYRVHEHQASATADRSHLVYERLSLAPDAWLPCSDRCPGRLTSLVGLRSGHPAAVCSRYLRDLRLRELRQATGVARVRREGAALRRGVSLLRQELRAGWETRRTPGWVR
jgi:glycosyltransferase involved in cell wall biosynthesis